MITKRITICIDPSLPERSARISSKTWKAARAKKGGTAFFPEGSSVLVGADPFDPDYILFVVDEEMPDDSFVVSADVKKKFYPATNHLDV